MSAYLRRRDRDSEITFERATAIYNLIVAMRDIHLMECDECADSFDFCPEFDWIVLTEIKWSNRITLLRRNARA